MASGESNPAPLQPQPNAPGPGPCEWIRGDGPDADVVLSSRVRLARNLAGLPFPGKSSPAQRARLIEMVRPVLGALPERRAVWIDLHDRPTFDRTLLVERHLISKQLARGRSRPADASQPDAPAPEPDKGPSPDPRAVVVSVDERLAVMVNEEDHLRIQVIRSGMALAQAWRDADAADDWIERHLDLAYSPRYGFVTACPTNLGTGLRMSVMMHLPALRMTGEIEKVKRAAADMNLAVRGYYGEHSDAAGDFYQISNQVTLGKSEAIILRELQDEIIPRVIDYERHARATLRASRRSFLEDQVFRARGMLASARLLSTEEAMQGLSLLRLGSVTGLITSPDQKTIAQLMLQVQPAHLQRALGMMDQEQRLISRATLVRQHFAQA